MSTLCHETFPTFTPLGERSELGIFLDGFLHVVEIIVQVIGDRQLLASDHLYDVRIFPGVLKRLVERVAQSVTSRRQTDANGSVTLSASIVLPPASLLAGPLKGWLFRFRLVLLPQFIQG